MNDLIDSVIRSGIANQYVYSKVRFDNAKDTNELYFASNENAEMLVKAVEYRLHDRVEQMLSELIERAADQGKLTVRAGNKWYELTEVTTATSPDPDATTEAEKNA